MLKREDMMELTRRMTPARTSIDRIAGCYFDEDGYVDGTFNTGFLKLKTAEKEKKLNIAKTIPFSETNRQLIELDFPGETRESGDMMRLLDAIMDSGMKDDALLDTFYEVAAEKQSGLSGRPFAIVLFHGIYDIPRMGSDKAEQWESEEVYEYMICSIGPVLDDYELDLPVCGFLYPSFHDRSADIFHIAVYEQEPQVSGEGLIQALGCTRE